MIHRYDLHELTVIDVEYTTIVVDTFLPSWLLTRKPHTQTLNHKQLQQFRKAVTDTARN